MGKVAVGVVIKEDKVLVIKRAKSDGGFWAFPGGEIEKGKTIRQTVVDEVKEETGVVCRVVKRLGSRVHPLNGKPISYWQCEYVSGTAMVTVPVEIEQVVWLSAAQAIKQLGPTLFAPVKALLTKLAL